MTNLEHLRNKDAIDLADFLEEVTTHCFSFGRGNMHACDDCPLQKACDGRGIREWLEQEAEIERLNEQIVALQELCETITDRLVDAKDKIVKLKQKGR